MIKSLTLKNFRSFKNKKLDFKKELVIVHGDNAKGKSTVLEAIYLILNGTTPWGGGYENFLNFEEDKKEKKEDFFTITAEIEDDTLTMYQDSSSKSFLVNKKRTTKKKFFNFQKANLFSPEQIELLMYLPQKRREFLDDLISKIDIDYAEKVVLYSKVLRQRNSYLKKLSKVFYETGKINQDDSQMDYWTQSLVKLSTKIMIRRCEVVEKLQSKSFFVEYRPSLSLNFFENMLDEEELKKIYLKQMKENTKKDIATGFTNIGTHRDDWAIFSAKQDLKKFGSRGEKRLAIARLILQTQEIYKEFLGYYPVLLLDDISAELDKDNSEKIFKEKILQKQQTFIATIDPKQIPKEILGKSQKIKLD
jgi:DNA replication and repair protein RecF